MIISIAAIEYMFEVSKVNIMRKQLSKALVHVKKVEKVISTGVKSTLITRIDEEELFNLFTADIMKMKIKFTR